MTRISATSSISGLARSPFWKKPFTTSARGKRYLVLHGDKFDGVVCFAPWLAKLGDSAYEMSMSLNSGVNRIRRFFRLPYWSLSAYLKFKVKKAVEFVSRFEDAVVREADSASATA